MIIRGYSQYLQIKENQLGTLATQLNLNNYMHKKTMHIIIYKM